MQGRITKILNMKPPEILSLLEEAASTKLYENKKEVALKTIQKKDSKLREMDKIIAEDINPTIKKLREERSSYLEYEKIMREVSHLEKFIIAYDFTCLKEIKERSKDDLVTLEKNLKDEKARMEELRKLKEAVESRIEELCNQRDEYQGPMLEQLENAMSECQKADAVAKGASQRASESLRAAKKRVKAMEAQCIDLDEQLLCKHKAAEDAADGKQYRQTLKAFEEAKVKLEAAEKHLQAVKSGLSSGENGVTSSLSEQARTADTEKLSAETELAELNMREKYLKKELVKQEAAIIKAFGRISCSGESKEEVEQEKLKAQIAELSQQLARVEADDQAVGSEAELCGRQVNLVREANELRHQANRLSAQFPQLQFEYTNPEPNFDKRRVHGPVAKLFRIKDEKYAVALEVIAENKLQNIVVDTELTGKILLERGNLRQRVTMLPLTHIRGNPVPESVIERAQALFGKANVITALSLVDYDDALKPVMEYVFGDVLVCPDMDIAKRVAFHATIARRTVTLEGDVFDPQGTLSGGSRNPATQNLLTRIFEWRDVETAAENCEEKVAQGVIGIRNAKARAEKIRELREALNSCRHSLHISETEMRQTDKHRLHADLLATKDELKQVEKLMHEAKERLAQASKKAELAGEKAVNAVAEREKEQKNAEKALSEARQLLEKCAADVREKDALKEGLRLEAEELAKELENSKISLEKAKSSLEEAEKEEKLRIDGAKSSAEEFVKARKAVSQQRDKIDQTVKALSDAEKEASQLVQFLNQTNNAIDKLSHQIEMQNKESSEAYTRINQLLHSFPWIEREKHLFGVENTSYNFSTRDIPETRRRIQEIKEQKERLSRTVNMRAVNMLGSAEKQFSDLIRKRDIVLADKEKIQSVIDDLDKRKEEVLINAHTKVNADFCNIFSTLLPGTRARLSPPSGMTVLDGLEIKVAFGNVWKESLTELSGGQRSLAALSLILALLLFKPAPIYILDEVDAALDLSHTQNIGQLIKNHFRHSQFIVVSLKDGMFNNANVLFKTAFIDGVSTVTRHVPLQLQRHGGDDDDDDDDEDDSSDENNNNNKNKNQKQNQRKRRSRGNSRKL
nr:unnamed protein product [Trichobilharzia regenti]